MYIHRIYAISSCCALNKYDVFCEIVVLPDTFVTKRYIFREGNTVLKM